LVETVPGSAGTVSSRTVSPGAFGDFLCAVFDEWLQQDIGRIKVQIFEEAAATALGQDHSLCIFKKTCGDVPVLEHNGDLFACDHFVDEAYLWGNIRETPLKDLVEDPRQAAFGRIKQDSLPRQCRQCEVLSLCNGGCPKDRIHWTADGEAGLNYLCAGYKRFFTHCRPFLAQLSALHTRGNVGSAVPPPANHIPAHATGRNDPCPCGSGRKYKKCCMGK
jgi:uncharacterized protein